MRGPVGSGGRPGGARHGRPVRGGGGVELGAMDNRSSGRRRGVDPTLRRAPVRLAARGALAGRDARRGRCRDRRRPFSCSHCRRGAGTPGDGGAARRRPAMGASELAVHALCAARRVASRSRRGGAACHGARRLRHYAWQPAPAPRRGAGAAGRRAFRTDPRERRSRPRDPPGRSRRGAHAPRVRAAARVLRNAPDRRGRWRRHHPATGAGPNTGLGGACRPRAARRYRAPHHPGLHRHAVLRRSCSFSSPISSATRRPGSGAGSPSRNTRAEGSRSSPPWRHSARCWSCSSSAGPRAEPARRGRASPPWP